MITKTTAWIAFVIACALPISASAATSLNRCSPGAHKPGLLAQAWNDFMTALEVSHPTEAQRLVDLRLSLIHLSTEKKTLVTTVDQVVQNASVPDWLKARVEQIPTIQDDVEQIMAQIEDEARSGGLLGSSDSLSKLMRVLGRKRQVTLCELATVPVPLPSDKVIQVKTLLTDLQAEITALDSLDKKLGELIEAARKPH